MSSGSFKNVVNNFYLYKSYIYIYIYAYGGARGVIVILDGKGHSDTSSNPWKRLIAFHVALIPLGKV